jgi:Ni/Co efflux regulator RcnB
MCDILLPHNIDMMHTEKNVTEALFHTTMETEKSKDNVESRLDQANLGDRPKYNIPKPKPGKRWKKPATPYVLTKLQRKEY